jgi:hypothetical protein
MPVHAEAPAEQQERPWASPRGQRRALSHRIFDSVDSPATAELVSTRYRHTALFGKRVRWLPPHRLIPSFASADGQCVIYRRRSQVVVSEATDTSPLTHPAYVPVAATGMRARIDEFGFVRVDRPTRVQPRGPVADLDQTHTVEREVAEAVCRQMNQHVDAIAEAYRYTPPPGVQMVPLSSRPYAEPPPSPPPKREGAHRSQEQINGWLDARAAWLKRRFAWENGQRAIRELGERAAAGQPAAMSAHLVSCLQDILWPAPVFMNYGFVGAEEVRFDVRVPSANELPDREATVGYGHRIAVKSMTPVRQAMLHNRHAFGLVVRLVGEAFAALPTIRRVVVSGYQLPVLGQPSYIVSVAAERRIWSMLYAERWVTDGPPERAMRPLGGRFRLTGLGAFLPIEPFG